MLSDGFVLAPGDVLKPRSLGGVKPGRFDPGNGGGPELLLLLLLTLLLLLPPVRKTERKQKSRLNMNTDK